MAETKYGQYMKNLPPFQDYGLGDYRQGVKMDGDFLGLDVHVEFGAYWTAGRMGGENSGPHVHDFNEVMIWMGADTSDLGYLGAEVELYLGEEMEKHMIATSTAVFIPKGFQHFPATITRMESRFLFMVISCARKYTATPVVTDKDLSTIPIAGWGGKYRDKIQHLAFTRNGPWHYGPNNPDTHDGAITNIIAKEFDFNMSYESVRKAPYRFGPSPDKPHSHNYDEFGLMLGADTNDLSELGCEFETGLGEEIEMHRFNTPHVSIFPKGLPHGPGAYLSLYKPMIFAIIRPFGTGDVTRRPG